MAKAIIYTKGYCPYCHRAKDLLDHMGVDYTEIDVQKDKEKEQEMRELSGRTTVPQIFLHLGGCDDLEAYVEKGSLDDLLS